MQFPILGELTLRVVEERLFLNDPHDFYCPPLSIHASAVAPLEVEKGKKKKSLSHGAIGDGTGLIQYPRICVAFWSLFFGRTMPDH